MALQMKSLRHIMMYRQSHTRSKVYPFRRQQLYDLPTDLLTLFFSLLVLQNEEYVMGQESAVEATIKGGVSKQIVISSNSFQMVTINEGIINIALLLDQPANGGQLL